MMAKRKAAGLAPIAAQVKFRHEDFSTPANEHQGASCLPLGTFLSTLLERYKAQILALPCTPQRSAMVEHIDEVLGLAGKEGGIDVQ